LEYSLKESFLVLERCKSLRGVPVHLGGLWGSIFSPYGGNVFWKIPREIPYPVTTGFGSPLSADPSSEHVERAVHALAGIEHEPARPNPQKRESEMYSTAQLIKDSKPKIANPPLFGDVKEWYFPDIDCSDQESYEQFSVFSKVEYLKLMSDSPNPSFRTPLPHVMILTRIERLGAWVLDSIQYWGKAWIFLWRILSGIFSPPFRARLLFQQVAQIGFHSTFVVALIGIFTGAVLAVQGEYTLSKFGATAFTGPAVALSLIRELGPVLTALMVIGRSGSAITAELGIMKITEQVDALRSMAVDPMKYLMVPRFLAGVIAMPLLSAIFIAIGIFGGYLVAVGVLGLSSGTFVSQMVSAVGPVDVYSGFIKALVFGVIFGWISCFKGYTCSFGAIGVNKATTQSVVTSSVCILVTDYFLTSILTRVFL